MCCKINLRSTNNVRAQGVVICVSLYIVKYANIIHNEKKKCHVLRSTIIYQGFLSAVQFLSV